MFLVGQKINGKKFPDNEPKNNDNIRSTREFGDYSLEILLETEKYKIKNQKPLLVAKNGLLSFYYELEQTGEDYTFDITD